MDYAEFAAVYERDARLPKDTDPRIQDVMRLLEYSGERFGEILHGILRDAPIDPTETALMATAIDSVKEANLIRGDLVRQVEGASADSPEIRYRRVRRFGFLQLTWDVISLWAWERMIRSALPAEEWRCARDVTALRFAQFSALQYEASDDPMYYLREHDVLRAIRYGLLAEGDSLVALLDMCARHPEYVAFPAPPQFENGRNRRFNIDFIVLRPADRQAVGIQVKTQVKRADVKSYDPRRVILVDAAIDFGETLMARTRRLHSDRQLRPQPGLVIASAAAMIDPYEMARHGRPVGKHPEVWCRMRQARDRSQDGGRLVAEARELMRERIEHRLGPLDPKLVRRPPGPAEISRRVKQMLALAAWEDGQQVERAVRAMGRLRNQDTRGWIQEHEGAPALDQQLSQAIARLWPPAGTASAQDGPSAASPTTRKPS